MKNFAITGVAGYVAPRHLRAIKDTGNNLVAAVDPHDSVGILDSFFPKTSFFSEFERFDRHLEKLKRKKDSERINYLSICSPNHLHDAHIRLALRLGADAICEKPLVLNPWNLDLLEELEKETGSKVYTVLQLRHHPVLIELKEKLAKENSFKHNVELTYIAPRGLWYNYSWKGSNEKSGGISTNIGIHFFDLLIWLFGEVKNTQTQLSTPDAMAGNIELKNANIKWFLSINQNHLPEEFPDKNSSYRSIKIDDKEIEFTKGFADLHTKTYEGILNGNGYGISDSRPSIELVHKIRNDKIKIDDVVHPLAKKILGK